MRFPRTPASVRRRLPALAAALVLAGCGEDSVAPPVSLSDRADGQLDAGGAARVRVGNPLGPVSVDGENLGPIVRWFLDKHVTAPTVADAQAALAAITFEGTGAGDSLIARVAIPAPSATITYETGLSLGVPAAMHCTIDEALGEVSARFLSGDLDVTTDGPVTVAGHHGNLHVAGGAEIVAEVALPPAGHCSVSTTAGRIVATIPPGTSAHVSITAGGGTIDVVGLLLTDVVRTDHTLTGTLDSGDGEIHLESTAGNVVLQALGVTQGR